MTVSCVIKRSSKVSIEKQIEFSNSKHIKNCGKNIFSRELGQNPACSGLRSQWEGRSGNNRENEVQFSQSAGSKRKESAGGSEKIHLRLRKIILRLACLLDRRRGIHKGAGAQEAGGSGRQAQPSFHSHPFCLCQCWTKASKFVPQSPSFILS